MRLELILGGLIVLTDLSGSVHAELLGATTPPPAFSAADTQIIQRNELLSSIFAGDPWLVRRLLDLIDQQKTNAQHAAAMDSQGFEPARNPDLTQASRTAEGSIAWFELLKQALAEKKARDKDSPAIGNRSAEGSVDIIEMMKRAKAEKEAKPAR